MKVAVVGSRSINDRNLIISFIEESHSFDKQYDKLISGGARGVDTIAEDYAKSKGIRTVIFYPDWEKYGNKAGFIRNADIISKCDKCIVIWDGVSSGTEHDIELCEQMKKPCYIYNLSTNEKYSINEYIQGELF